MSGVVAVVLTVLSLPFLVARAGGRPPNPGVKLAALAPVGTVPAVAGAVVAALFSWWLALILAVPALILLAWQLPPARRAREPGAAPGGQAAPLRVLTLNVMGGAADAEAIAATVADLTVDILAVQELTSGLLLRLGLTGLAGLLPHSQLEPREGSSGTGLWSRWPLAPLPAVDGLIAAAPRARIDPPGGPAVTVTAVHPVAPVADREHLWRHELGLIQAALAATSGPQLVAGDFNASRDHRAFRALLRVGLRRLRRRRPPAALARLHLARGPPLPAADAAGSRAGLTRRGRGSRGADRPRARHRSSGRAGRARIPLPRLTPGRPVIRAARR